MFEPSHVHVKKTGKSIIHHLNPHRLMNWHDTGSKYHTRFRAALSTTISRCPSDDQNGVKVKVPFNVVGGSGLVSVESVNIVFVKLAVPVVLSIVTPAQEMTHFQIVKGVAPSSVTTANKTATRLWVVLKATPRISS